MEITKRLIIIFFCVGFTYGQRIPQTFFEPVVVTNEQKSRIDFLGSIVSKTEQQQYELAVLHASVSNYENSFNILKNLVETHPENFNYQYLLGGVSGTLASELPRVKSLAYVRTMKTAFENTVKLAPDSIAVQFVLLELYAELPWVLGGSNKKAYSVLKKIKSISPVQGFLSEGYFYRTTNKNKESLVAYLNAVNEVELCSKPQIPNDSFYVLGVLSYYLRKDISKSLCFFEQYIKNYNKGNRYPKSFAKHYIFKLSSINFKDNQMEDILIEHDHLTRWIQNNFK